MWFRKIRYFIASMVKSDSVGEELAQDVFVRLWQSREALVDVRSPEAYIHRMARNAALNYLRHKYVVDNFTSEFAETDSASLEEDIFVRDTELLIRMTVKRMPPQRRRVFEMSRHEYLSNDDIAQQLGIAKKSVENHLNLALREIRKVLAVWLIVLLS